MTEHSAEEAFDLIQSDTEAIPLLGPGNGGSSHQSRSSVAERWREGWRGGWMKSPPRGTALQQPDRPITGKSDALTQQAGLMKRANARL